MKYCLVTKNLEKTTPNFTPNFFLKNEYSEFLRLRGFIISRFEIIRIKFQPLSRQKGIRVPPDEK